MIIARVGILIATALVIVAAIYGTIDHGLEMRPPVADAVKIYIFTTELEAYRDKLKRVIDDMESDRAIYQKCADSTFSTAPCRAAIGRAEQ